MSFDKLDTKISEAAEHHHPSYDEKAWQNMEKLLDKHLPQDKKKKRRIFFILFFFLLLGTAVLGYYLIVEKNNNKETSNPVTANSNGNNTTENVGIKKIESNLKKGLEEESVSQNNKIKTSSSDDKKFNKENQKSDVSIITAKKSKSEYTVLTAGNKNDLKEAQSDRQEYYVNEKLKSSNTAKNISETNEMNTTEGVDLKVISEREGVDIISQEKSQLNKKVELQIGKNENQEIGNNKTDQELISKKEMKTTGQNPDEISIQENKEKPKAKTSSSFFLSVSAGPDLSFVASNKMGSTKLLGGLGIGYIMNNGFTFRSGFYSGRKVYSASPDAYNPPAGFAQYYPILENVDADCKIYEIPISVSYNFGKPDKKNWFVSAGISSLIMKEEKYNYTYKYVASGPSYKKDWTINNEYKHLFSVLALSGGYQRKLSKNVSLMMEPYFKIPLQGVGYGKVKLNNAGVLFTLTVSPFNSNFKK